MLHQNLLHLKRVFLGRRAAESTLANELDFHFEQLTREKIESGIAPDEARRQARLELGGAEQLKEEVRDQWGTRWWDNLRGDLLFAVRNLSNSRAFTLLAVLTLGLGIGCNTALFSVIYAAVLKPLPFASDSRLVELRMYDTAAQRPQIGFSVKDIDDLRSGSRLIESFVEFHSMRFILLGRAESEVVETGVVSGAYFDHLGVKALYGRTFVTADESEHADAALILSHRYFQNSWGGDPSVVGKTVRLNDRMHTIIGVLPPLPEYPVKIDVYMPTTSCPTRAGAGFRANRAARMMTVFARLKPGVTAAQAEEETKVLVRRMRAANPGDYPKHEQWGVHALPLKDEITRQAKPAFTMLFAATALVVLIACANIANLTITRMLQRGRELAIRTSLGATRARLMQQLAVEGLLVGLLACGVALLLARQTLVLLAPFARRFSTRAGEIQVDQTVLLFCIGVTLVTVLLAYLLPAQPALKNLVTATRDGSHNTTASSGKMRLRSVLVTAQVALSFLLVSATGLLLRSFVELTNTDAGVESSRVIAMQVTPNWTKIGDAAKFRTLFQVMLEKVRNTPGVISAGVGSKVPLNQRLPFMRDFVVEGQVLAPDAPRPVLDVAVVSPGYFETLRTPLTSGRAFRDSDSADAPPVAMINNSAAKHFWRGDDPLGRRVSFDGGKKWLTIVGVVADVRHYGLDHEATDEIYAPFAQSPGGTNLVIRTAVEPASLTLALRRLLHDVDPEHAVASMHTLEEIRTESIAPQRTVATLLAIFAALTLAIMIAGVSGVAALSVTQRKAEIGIRVACGARPVEIIRMVLRQHLSLVLIGVAAGIAASLVLGRLLSTFLYRTQPADPLTLAGACLLLLGAGTLACWWPARKAASMDPLASLRSE